MLEMLSPKSFHTENWVRLEGYPPLIKPVTSKLFELIVEDIIDHQLGVVISCQACPRYITINHLSISPKRYRVRLAFYVLSARSSCFPGDAFYTYGNTNSSLYATVERLKRRTKHIDFVVGHHREGLFKTDRSTTPGWVG